MNALIRKELTTLFVSPLAWTLLGVMQFILAWIFLQQLESFSTLQSRFTGQENAPGITDLVATPLISSAGILLIFIIPLLTMRSFADEYRLGTIRLLLASPAGSGQLVAGKFAALILFLSISLILTAAMPLSLLVSTTLDFGKLAAGLLALLLMTGATVAVGLFMSSITESPAVAAVSTYGVLLFMWITGHTGYSSANDEYTRNLITELSFAPHFDALLTGLVNSADIAFFVVITGLLLALTSKQLYSRFNG